MNPDDYCSKFISLLAIRLKRTRQNLELSKNEVAQRAGLGNASISRVEGDQRSPALTTVLRISIALGVPFSDIIRNIENDISANYQKSSPNTDTELELLFEKISKKVNKDRSLLDSLNNLIDC